MSSRDDILAAVRVNAPAGVHALPDLPDFPFDDGGDRIACFQANLEAMGGKLHRPDAHAGLAQVIRELFPDAKVIASAIADDPGTMDLATVRAARELAGVDLAVVRAAFAVAETGSVLLTDTGLRSNALAYLAQHLLVIVDPRDVLLTMQEGYRRPEFFHHSYTCFHTGPSATADIEGVLIHGAQGVRSLTVVVLPTGSAGP